MNNKFSKEQFMKSSCYKDKRELIDAILNDKRYYTKAEVKKLISKYLERKVL